LRGELIDGGRVNDKRGGRRSHELIPCDGYVRSGRQLGVLGERNHVGGEFRGSAVDTAVGSLAVTLEVVEEWPLELSEQAQSDVDSSRVGAEELREVHGLLDDGKQVVDGGKHVDQVRHFNRGLEVDAQGENARHGTVDVNTASEGGSLLLLVDRQERHVTVVSTGSSRSVVVHSKSIVGGSGSGSFGVDFGPGDADRILVDAIIDANRVASVGGLLPILSRVENLERLIDSSVRGERGNGPLSLRHDVVVDLHLQVRFGGGTSANGSKQENVVTVGVLGDCRREGGLKRRDVLLDAVSDLGASRVVWRSISLVRRGRSRVAVAVLDVFATLGGWRLVRFAKAGARDGRTCGP